MEEHRTLDDKELYDRLSQAGLVERLTTSMEWGLLKEASRRIVDRAIDKFALSPPEILDDKAAMADLRAIIKKWKYGIFSEIEMLKQDGEAAFYEAQNRGIIGETKTEK